MSGRVVTTAAGDALTAIDNGVDLRRSVGALFEHARGDVSLRDFAEKVGMAHGTLHQFEQGRDNPTLDRLERMARLYGLRLRITVEPL
jgi:transcriptional regulator with XRE-family HTH domain